MKKGICIFGATGFVGSSIVDEVERLGLEWIGISYKRNDNPKIYSINDLQKETFNDLIAKHPYVINASGGLKPKDFDLSTTEPLEKFWNNMMRLKELLESSAVEKLLHISSAGTVYGEYNNRPHKETDTLYPIGWYGRMNMIEELIFEKFASSKGLDFLCARVTNPYGNSNNPTHGFIDVMIDAVRNKQVFRTYKTCDHQRDFIYSPDMAEAIVQFMFSGHKGYLNIGSGESIKLHDILSFVETHYSSFKIIKDLQVPDYDVRISAVDISRMKGMKIMNVSKNVYDYIVENLNQNPKKK